MDINPNRVAWVDYAKGFLHRHGGDDALDPGRPEAAAGETSWMGALVAFAKPFRMPDFFLISGLFLARVIDRNWRAYLDKKVVHFAYFYALWVTIQFAFKAPQLRRRSRLGRRGAGLRARLHRPVRHAVVHLPPAHLLRGDQAHARRAAGDAVVRGGVPPDRRRAYGLDRDRRVLLPLRLFLLGLRARRLTCSTSPGTC